MEEKGAKVDSDEGVSHSRNAVAVGPVMLDQRRQRQFKKDITY